MNKIIEVQSLQWDSANIWKAAVPLRRLCKPRNPGVAARSVGLSAVAPTPISPLPQTLHATAGARASSWVMHESGKKVECFELFREEHLLHRRLLGKLGIPVEFLYDLRATTIPEMIHVQEFGIASVWSSLEVSLGILLSFNSRDCSITFVERGGINNCCGQMQLVWCWLNALFKRPNIYVQSNLSPKYEHPALVKRNEFRIEPR